MLDTTHHQWTQAWWTLQCVVRVCRVLVGAGYGLLATTVYTVEVVGREARGSVLVFAGVTRSLGTILVYTLGALLPWHHIAYLAALVPALAALLLLRSPESPVHLAARGRLQEAELALRRLHQEPYDASPDLQDILNSLERSKDQSSQPRVSKLSVLMNVGRHPEIYKPFLIIFWLRCWLVCQSSD